MRIKRLHGERKLWARAARRQVSRNPLRSSPLPHRTMLTKRKQDASRINAVLTSIASI